MVRFKNEAVEPTETKNEVQTNQTTEKNENITTIDTDTGSSIGVDVPNGIVNKDAANPKTDLVSEGSKQTDTETGGGASEVVTPEKTEPESTKEQQPKKDPRGRKPGGKNKEKSEKTEMGGDKKEPGKKTVEDLLNAVPNVGQNEGIAVQQPVIKKVTVDVSKFVSGALALALIDSLAPTLICKAAAMIDKKYSELDPDDIKLDSSEKKELAPLADEAVKEMLGEMSPTAALIFALAILYGGKTLTAI